MCQLSRRLPARGRILVITTRLQQTRQQSRTGRPMQQRSSIQIERDERDLAEAERVLSDHGPIVRAPSTFEAHCPAPQFTMNGQRCRLVTDQSFGGPCIGLQAGTLPVHIELFELARPQGVQQACFAKHLRSAVAGRNQQTPALPQPLKQRFLGCRVESFQRVFFAGRHHQRVDTFITVPAIRKLVGPLQTTGHQLLAAYSGQKRRRLVDPHVSTRRDDPLPGRGIRWRKSLDDLFAGHGPVFTTKHNRHAIVNLAELHVSPTSPRTAGRDRYNLIRCLAETCIDVVAVRQHQFHAARKGDFPTFYGKADRCPESDLESPAQSHGRLRDGDCGLRGREQRRAGQYKQEAAKQSGNK